MTAAGVTTHYLMDGDRPLSADAAGNVTYYLYGLGAISEKTASWSYSLSDGSNTPRQLTNSTGAITLSASYTPWGDTLTTSGTGNFTYGYFGGVMDAATGLIYVGNGQYYDPQTGRFLTRDAKPNQNNPYTPIDPTSALFAPLALLAMVFGNKKKRGKWDSLVILLVLGMAVGMSLAACGGSGTPTPPPSRPDPSPVTPAPSKTPEPPGNNPGSTPNDPGSATPSPVPCPTPTLIPTGTPISPTPTPDNEPWKHDPDYRYDPSSKSIPGWGADWWVESIRQDRTKHVWKWICTSGGWWGAGKCPPLREMLAPFLLNFEIGEFWDDAKADNGRGNWAIHIVSTTIRFRFGDGELPNDPKLSDALATSLSTFTSFVNPDRRQSIDFNEEDWRLLTNYPPLPIMHSEMDSVFDQHQDVVRKDNQPVIFWWDAADGDNNTNHQLYDTFTRRDGYWIKFGY